MLPRRIDRAAAHAPDNNQLLAALPASACVALFDAMEPVALPLGQVLYEPDVPMAFAYFPTTAGVSLHYVGRNGESVELAGVGREGLIGIPLFMGGDTTCSSAVVHTAGQAWRLARAPLLQAFAQDGPLRPLLLRYTQSLITQISQNAACHRHHSIEQQLSRWLLQAVDRSPASEIVITQDLVAGMLGVRRESVTQAAGLLQRAGHISYRRGHITVLDHQALQRSACECYAVVKQECARLLPMGATPA
ncbi:Crp/Fnr family transcriptional regulator [Methylibium petroleiphilum]